MDTNCSHSKREGSETTIPDTTIPLFNQSQGSRLQGITEHDLRPLQQPGILVLQQQHVAHEALLLFDDYLSVVEG